MDELTRRLLDENRRNRRALEAIRDGHQAGLDFLTELDFAAPNFPDNIIDAVKLVETVARVALGEAGEYEFRNTLLRRMLLQYGAHLPQCRTNNDLPCDCSWWGVRAKLIADTAPTYTESSEEKLIP